VADGNLQDIADGQLAGEWAIGRFDAEVNLLADVFKAGVAHERAGQEACFGQDLKAVADTEHQPTTGSKALDGLHDRGKTRNGAGAQVVAESKPAWNQYSIHASQIFRIVPEEGDRLLCHFGNYVECVVVTVGTGKDQDPEFHTSRVSVSREDNVIFLITLVVLWCREKAARGLIAYILQK
jgi:hypothetical protein